MSGRKDSTKKADQARYDAVWDFFQDTLEKFGAVRTADKLGLSRTHVARLGEDEHYLPAGTTITRIENLKAGKANPPRVRRNGGPREAKSKSDLIEIKVGDAIVLYDRSEKTILIETPPGYTISVS